MKPLCIDHTDRQLLSALHDLHSLARRDAVGNLSTVLLVVHHQKLQVLHVAHGELVQSVGEHVAGASIRSVTNVGHQSGTTETTSVTSINTLGLSPVLLQQESGKHFAQAYIHSLELIRLETGEGDSSLLNNLNLARRTHSNLNSVRTLNAPKPNCATTSTHRLKVAYFAKLEFDKNNESLLFFFLIIRTAVMGDLEHAKKKKGPSGESNSGPLAPKARIIPLDHKATCFGFSLLLFLNETRQLDLSFHSLFKQTNNLITLIDLSSVS